MTENTPSEPLRNPERLVSQNNIALQMRLYMGGDAVVYPSKEIKTVTAESVSREHGKNKIDTLNKLGITATTEGYEEWSQGEKGRMKHDQKVQTWAHEVDTLFKSEGTKSHQNILQLLAIGGINLSSINRETALKLYDRYFAKTEEAKAVSFGETTTYIPANIKRFVDDVIASHTENGSVNYFRLESNLSSLTFLAGMFGTNTSTLLQDYLTAYIRFTKDASSQQAFLQEVTANNRINDLTPQEDQLLKWFYETSTQTRVVTVGKPIVIKPPTTPTTEPVVIKLRQELTQELARRDPEQFKQSAFALLRERYPLVAQVWDIMVKTGRISEKDLEFDASTWTGLSDNVNHKIKVGIQPTPEEIKYRLFEDQRLGYQDDVIYKLSHEISHSLVDWILENKSDNRVENLVGGFIAMREKDKTHGFSSLGSAPYYQAKGPRSQAIEDIGELFNMYLQDPAYSRRFLNYISDPSHKDEIKKVGLIYITSNTAKTAFAIVESVVQNYLKQKTPEPQKTDARIKITSAETDPTLVSEDKKYPNITPFRSFTEKGERIPVELVGEYDAAETPILVHQNALSDAQWLLSSESFLEERDEKGQLLGLERGGVILGREKTDPKSGRKWIEVTHFLHIPKELFPSAGGAHVTFGADTWSHAIKKNDQIQELLKYSPVEIIGWAHTHPQMSVFLSGYDTFIQDNYFTEDRQIALLIAPKIEEAIVDGKPTKVTRFEIKDGFFSKGGKGTEYGSVRKHKGYWVVNDRVLDDKRLTQEQIQNLDLLLNINIKDVELLREAVIKSLQTMEPQPSLK